MLINNNIRIKVVFLKSGNRFCLIKIKVDLFIILSVGLQGQTVAIFRKRKADLHFPATPDGVDGNVAAFCLSTLAVNVGKFFVPL